METEGQGEWLPMEDSKRSQAWCREVTWEVLLEERAACWHHLAAALDAGEEAWETAVHTFRLLGQIQYELFRRGAAGSLSGETPEGFVIDLEDVAVIWRVARAEVNDPANGTNLARASAYAALMEGAAHVARILARERGLNPVRVLFDSLEAAPPPVEG